MLFLDDPCVDCRFTCDWDPPAGHDWAGYPIRADAGMQGFIDKTLDPKKQYRCESFFILLLHLHLSQMHIFALSPASSASSGRSACLITCWQILS